MSSERNSPSIDPEEQAAIARIIGGARFSDLMALELAAVRRVLKRAASYHDCGDECDGMRCHLPQGHDGEHEGLSTDGIGIAEQWSEHSACLHCGAYAFFSVASPEECPFCNEERPTCATVGGETGDDHVEPDAAWKVHDGVWRSLHPSFGHVHDALIGTIAPPPPHTEN